ncbi:substrate-binding and vWA domain-containing protein [Streptomyces sp. BI20]|uniref:substrate-binding and vWA domain-containing protein n=1 Tax=Streptomyces sp. BI20 TaxID=3403460 RepID=UPI003C718C13
MRRGPARRRRGARVRRALPVWLVVGVLWALAGCDGSAPGPTPPTGASGSSGASGSTTAGALDPSKPPAPYREGRLRILASSELADVEPLLRQAEKSTGVAVDLTWAGTREIVEQVASGKADRGFDAVWPASDAELRLRPEAAGRLSSATPVMSSPVAIGGRPAALARLGWKPQEVTWSAVYDAVAAGKLGYGMTDPVRSNSGFSALVAVASALSGAQSALTEADVAKAGPRLRTFFSGQKLTSGSSGWLATAYARRGDVDALVNYESVLLSLNRDAGTDLTVIRPRDGVITASYPLTLLTAAPAGARESGRRLTEWLRSTEGQRLIAERTLRRPVVAGVASKTDPSPRRELPFPGGRAVADRLLAGYENELRRPSRTVYVLDTSGSMAADGRIDRLRSALTELTGTGSAGPGERFRDREEVTLMPFGSGVKEVRRHVVEPGAGAGGSLDAIRADVARLSPSGGTAVYTSLRAAYEELGRDGGKDAFTSVVLMTDGESGDEARIFEEFHAALPAERRHTPVFAVLFGDGDRAELTRITELTGGRLFDATAGEGSLAGAFEEIRGYQ